MPSFEIGPTRPVGAVQVKTLNTETGLQSVKADDQPATSGSVASSTPQVETSEAVKAGTAPVNSERVAEIRKAIESGRYPLIPAKIADAMIAAGMLWRSPQ